MAQCEQKKAPAGIGRILKSTLQNDQLVALQKREAEA
jgi:hypothetical protein